MKVFLDTSVMIAAFLENDLHHEKSRELLLQSAPSKTACGSHSVAEFYSVITRLPPPLQLRIEQAWLLVEEIRARVTPVALTAEEHFRALKRAAEAGIKGGAIYDALLLSCARKFGADRIYTLNLRHFQAVAPDIADRIVAP
jgi:predicted nucleic acid-binding protein